MQSEMFYQPWYIVAWFYFIFIFLKITMSMLEQKMKVNVLFAEWIKFCPFQVIAFENKFAWAKHAPIIF